MLANCFNCYCQCLARNWEIYVHCTDCVISVPELGVRTTSSLHTVKRPDTVLHDWIKNRANINI